MGGNVCKCYFLGYCEDFKCFVTLTPNELFVMKEAVKRKKKNKRNERASSVFVIY